MRGWVIAARPGARCRRSLWIGLFQDCNNVNSEILSSLGWSEFFELQRSRYAPDLLPARVSAEHRGRLDLLGPHGPLYATPGQDDVPRVGDWLLIQPRPGADRVRVHARLDRKSWVERQAAGRRTERQIVATNLDRVFILTSLNQDFNLRRVERYLSAVRAGHVSPVVVLSKADLAPERVSRHLSDLERVSGDAPVISVSALYREGLDPLRALLGPGLTVALIGSSGVGKSTLVNALLEEEAQATTPIRAGDERGQHRTTARSLHLLPGGQGLLVDTPGMRELALWSGDGLDNTFSDVDELALQCRFRDCEHRDEPGCAVQEAISEGTLEAGRLENHRKLARETAWQSARADVFQERELRRRFVKKVRERLKDRY